MSIEKNTTSFEQQVSAALLQSAQLARKEGIKTGTGIVIMVDGKLVEISADELKKQSQQDKDQSR